MITTDVTSTVRAEYASVTDVHQQFTQALADGLPEPLAISINFVLCRIHIHAEENIWEVWRRWWNQHGAGPWTTDRTDDDLITTSGQWQGWTVMILSSLGGAR